MVKTYKKGASKKLTEHFNLSEMHCHGKGCCDTTKLDIAVVKIAEKMRCALNCPITVESAYRCNKHNIEVGGANGSGHTYGTALDLTTSRVSRNRLSVLAELCGASRIGIYETDNKKCMVHIGVGNKCHWVNTGNYLNTSHSFLNGEWKKPTLKVTQKSAKKYVRWVQGWLFALGFYTGAIDGNWGSKTQKSVNTFRKAHGWKNAEYLKTTGINALCKTK